MQIQLVNGKHVALCGCHELALRFSACTVDTSIIHNCLQLNKTTWNTSPSSERNAIIVCIYEQSYALFHSESVVLSTWGVIMIYYTLYIHKRKILCPTCYSCIFTPLLSKYKKVSTKSFSKCSPYTECMDDYM